MLAACKACKGRKVQQSSRRSKEQFFIPFVHVMAKKSGQCSSISFGSSWHVPLHVHANFILFKCPSCSLQKSFLFSTLQLYQNLGVCSVCVCYMFIHASCICCCLYICRPDSPNQIAESLLYKYKCLVNSFVEYRLHATCIHLQESSKSQTKHQPASLWKI